MKYTMTPPAAEAAFWRYYQDLTNDAATYSGRGTITGIVYTSLGLISSCGFVCYQVERIIQEDHNAITTDRRSVVHSLLQDVLWNWARTACELGVVIDEHVLVGTCPPEIRDKPPVMLYTSAMSRDAFLLSRFASDLSKFAADMLESGVVGYPKEVTETVRTKLANVYHAACVLASNLNLDLRDCAMCDIQSRLPVSLNRPPK